ncbi:hypothetical protein ONZ45_g6062 [Pleurotus djamor]|nr:hypothetical protein ONZ45_g6062 [Pleurotus djamor]
MGLVVPILRIAMVFLNVYDSFKTLKPPPVSSRNHGRVSVRGKTQRKRDMKGCLAIWIVWCCFMSYERFFERVISLFIPFYDEMKSLVLLFFIFTRARGAEPIYLHVIRPLLKPYTTTLDLCLDATCMIGDMIYTVSMLPVHYGFMWWRQYFRSKGGPDELQTNVKPLLEAPASPSSAGRASGTAAVARAPSARQKSRSQFTANSSQPTTSRRYPASEITRPGFPPVRAQTTGAAQAAKAHQSRPSTSRSTSQPVARPAGQRKLSGSISEPHPEVWIPPASSRNSDDEEDVPPEPAGPTISGLPVGAQEQVDEWRKYPPLPAAYPPTPMVTAVSLGSRSDQDFAVPTIAEEPVVADHDVFQGGDLTGGQGSDEDESDSDANYSEQEDAFNVSLRTPRSQRIAHTSGPYNDNEDMASSASSSSSSVRTRSTTLDTIDNASSMRTDSEDESFGDRMINSRHSGQPNGKVDIRNATLKARGSRSTIRARPKRQTSTARMIAMSQQQIVRSMSISTVDDDSDDPPLTDGNHPEFPAVTATETKRRKVVATKNGSVVNGARTTRAATRGSKAPSVNRTKAPGTLDQAKTTRTRASKQSGAPPIRPVSSTETSSELGGQQQRTQRTVRNR